MRVHRDTATLDLLAAAATVVRPRVARRPQVVRERSRVARDSALPQLAKRAAAILAWLAEHGPAGQIGVASVTAAARIVGWHLYQARAFLGTVAAPRERFNARRLDAWLLDWCRREGAQEVERRTIQNRGPNALRGKGALDAALAELAEAGRVRSIEAGRRKLVRVNPALLGGR